MPVLGSVCRASHAAVCSNGLPAAKRSDNLPVDFRLAGQDQGTRICARCPMQSVIHPGVHPSLAHRPIDGNGSESGVSPRDAQETAVSTPSCDEARPVEMRKTVADTHFKRRFCRIPANRSPILPLFH